MQFQNKISIVTGATRGIGKEIAFQFAKDGAVVCAIGSTLEKVLDLDTEVKKIGLGIDTFQCDVSKEDEVKATCSLILKKYGRVDILVNNAGIWRNGNSLFADSRSEDWKRKIDVNILGTMYFCRAVLNNMIEKRYGRIINIASVAGVYGIRTMTDYSMTKGAIISFTRALAKEVTEYGVTVNSVSPGNILSDPQKETDNPQLSFAGRSGTNAECANLVRFLASDDASYISGQNYLVDGCRKKM